MPIFDFATVVAATNNFSNANMIGEGGFGPVYKVTEVIYIYETLVRKVNGTLTLYLVMSRWQYTGKSSQGTGNRGEEAFE